MKKINLWTALTIFLLFPMTIHSAKIDYWDVQRRGANNFNLKTTTEQWFKSASEAGIEWVRYGWGKKWGQLMGNPSNYTGLIQSDLDEIKQSVAYAEKYNIKMVLVPISLPGALFRQLNGYKNDMRLWTDKKYWHMTAQFWQDLAREFKDNPTVVAYNIFNEPYPEAKTGVMEQSTLGDASRFIQWSDTYKGTARDVQLFHEVVIKAIREVDTETPIMVESGWYSQPNTYIHWTPLKDDKILYQFHMGEPYKFTAGANFRNKWNLSYPGMIPFGDDNGGQKILWNKDTMKTYFKPFFTWVEKYNIPSNRIVAGEISCMRRNKGCEYYLTDAIDIFNTKKYHWAFYSFREDWDGYNHELGNKGLGWQYWQDKEAGKNPPLPYEGRENNPQWQAIQNGLHAPKM